MSVYASVVIFSVTVFFYAIICEIFTALFCLTGMSETSARFQVVSMLTNSGFTTHESEVILHSRRRRTLARYTMLFGYVFSMTIIAAIINFFMALSDQEIKLMLWHFALPLGLLLLFVLLVRSQYVRRRINALAHRLINRYMEKRIGNHAFVMDDFGHSMILQAQIKRVPEPLRDKPLRETGLSDKKIMVVLLRRGAGDAVPPSADTVLRDGDRLLICGPKKAMVDSFEIRGWDA